jgi:hypothetical protein
VGILEILSTAELNVTAVYTATGEPGGTPIIDVEQVRPRIIDLIRVWKGRSAADCSSPNRTENRMTTTASVLEIFRQ